MGHKKRKLKVLFLDILTDNPALRKRVEKNIYKSGTYSEHMRKVLGLAKSEWQVIDASGIEFPKRFHQINALIIGGSAKNPVRGQSLPWMKEAYNFIRQAIKHRVPILGICGGLQFVVKALGGEIIYNPRGREFGTINIDIKHADPLWNGLSKNFMAQSNHHCMVGKINFPAKVLASSKMCGIQALAIEPNIRLVQFHPERRKQQTQAILKMIKQDYFDDTAKSQRDYKKLMKSIQDTSKTDNLIIKNFFNYFVYPNLS